ncbi:MAG: hypothetical protein CL609_25485 [Anaerolineaceae bacterium]|nr:hypothetical protein [Anaerolineaceae bacterium]
MLPSLDYRQQQVHQWQGVYQHHLQQRLAVTLHYIQNRSRAEVRTHFRSFTTAIHEAQRYPELYGSILAIITNLHPLPLRWGYGAAWQPWLNFAIQNTAQENKRALYHNDLADYFFFSGEFDKSMEHAGIVFSMANPSPVQLARSVRVLFTSYRSLGQSLQAEALIKEMFFEFEAHKPASEVSGSKALAWLRFNQNRLELLREEGKLNEALTLVEDMISLDEQLGRPDTLLTADLITHRSTLLWNVASYECSVADLKFAIDLYQSEDDLFNAESLYSNLGLVYWSMGKLDEAEQSLKRSILFYQKSALQQLISYDLGNLGLTYFARGDLEKAHHWTLEHINHCRKIGFVSEMNRGRRNLGTILYYLGAYEQAIHETEAAHTYFEKRGSRDGYGLDDLWIALCEDQLGKKEAAFSRASRILEWSKERESLVLEQVSLRCLAWFSPLEERVVLLERSLELAYQLNRLLEQAACLLMLASCTTDDLIWEKGLDLIKSIGAEPWLEGSTIDQPPFLPLLL